jgi:hypothetical protein
MKNFASDTKKTVALCWFQKVAKLLSEAKGEKLYQKNKLFRDLKIL